MKKYLLPGACIIFILCLIIYPQTAISSAFNGLTLWFNVVFPSLFPFFVASDILKETGFIRAVGGVFEPIMRPVFNVPGSGSFVLAMGITSGYPSGAKITCDLREKGLLSRIESERMLAYTNNSGPLFVTGAVATGMLKTPELGLFLLACHIGASLTVGILFRFYKKSDKVRLPSANIRRRVANCATNNTNNTKIKDKSFGIMFGDAIKNSLGIILSIGGFIIIFSVIINLLIETGIVALLSYPIFVILKPFGANPEIVQAVICGLFEITTGSNLVSTTSGIPLIWKLTALSFVLGWSGLSVHSQVLSIVSKTDISIFPYIAGKLLHGVIAAIYTFIFARIVVPMYNLAVPVFNDGPFIPSGGAYQSFSNSMIILAATFILYLLFFMFLQIRKKGVK